tara:strand:- start:3966 stop:4772 length:807 start_codon:yes stop_codon:yes gene_type:complete
MDRQLKISHATEYSYGNPVPYGLQQLRLRPADSDLQSVHDWVLDIEGGKIEAQFTDQHGNAVDLVSIDPGATQIRIACQGRVDTHDRAGVSGPHESKVPLWYFTRQTDLTRPGPQLARLLENFAPQSDQPVEQLHALSRHIADHVSYDTAATHATTTAEEAVRDGRGVCQDHAHIFLGLARRLGFPARYVSGYLMMDERQQQEASHAWAEAHIDGLGWVGFDVSNAISPDGRYVTLATGLDYTEAAPISGFIFGGGKESLIVTLQVQQ